MHLLYPLAALVGLSAAGMSRAQPPVTVLELYTSQGCSSCPPAEARLATLAARPDVIALAFHVDYWDELGWQDRFGLHAAVVRQQGYAHALGRSSVYTPQFIINGASDVLDGGEPSLRPIAAAAGWQLTLAADARQLSLLVQGPAKADGSELTLVSFRDRAVSAIGRGENQGRTLTEVHIVRSIETLAAWQGAPRRFEIERSRLPADATGVVALIQRPGPGAILAAAQLTLPLGN
jgi:hypothetical protein